MIAVDTNVLVRFLVDDDPAQSRRARSLIERHPIRLTNTVILEAAWVLSSIYGFDRARILVALTDVLGLEHVTPDDPSAVAQALAWFEAGLDFADALHVAASHPATRFATFDERLLRNAARAGIARVRPVPR